MIGRFIASLLVAIFFPCLQGGFESVNSTTQVCSDVHHIEEVDSDNHTHFTGYSNVCWRCHSSINSSTNRRCYTCGWYICNYCGACEYSCPDCDPAPNRGSGSSSSSNSDNSWIYIGIGALVIGGIIFFYKKTH